MKYLSDYTKEGVEEALNKAGAFWAFGQEQFNKQKREGVEYVSGGAGLVCPKDTYKQLKADLDNAILKGIEADIRENGEEAIIKRELINHECYYTGNIDIVAENLAEYGITRERIQEIYKAEYNKQDL